MEHWTSEDLDYRYTCGMCHDLATALHKIIENSKIVYLGIYEHENDEIIGHVLVKIGDKYLDITGLHNAEEVMNYWYLTCYLTIYTADIEIFEEKDPRRQELLNEFKSQERKPKNTELDNFIAVKLCEKYNIEHKPIEISDKYTADLDLDQSFYIY